MDVNYVKSQITDRTIKAIGYTEDMIFDDNDVLKNSSKPTVSNVMLGHKKLVKVQPEDFPSYLKEYVESEIGEEVDDCKIFAGIVTMRSTVEVTDRHYDSSDDDSATYEHTTKYLAIKVNNYDICVEKELYFNSHIGDMIIIVVSKLAHIKYVVRVEDAIDDRFRSQYGNFELNDIQKEAAKHITASKDICYDNQSTFFAKYPKLVKMLANRQSVLPNEDADRKKLNIIIAVFAVNLIIAVAVFIFALIEQTSEDYSIILKIGVALTNQITGAFGLFALLSGSLLLLIHISKNKMRNITNDDLCVYVYGKITNLIQTYNDELKPVRYLEIDDKRMIVTENMYSVFDTLQIGQDVVVIFKTMPNLKLKAMIEIIVL